MLKNISYDGIKLTIFLDDSDNDQAIQLVIKTNMLRTDIPVEKYLRICRIEIVSVANEIPLNSNSYFIPSNDFVGLMKEVRQGYNFFYGMKHGQYYFLSLKGYQELLGCCIYQESDITISFK